MTKFNRNHKASTANKSHRATADKKSEATNTVRVEHVDKLYKTDVSLNARSSGNQVDVAFNIHVNINEKAMNRFVDKLDLDSIVEKFSTAIFKKMMGGEEQSCSTPSNSDYELDTADDVVSEDATSEKKSSSDEKKSTSDDTSDDSCNLYKRP